MGYDSWCIENEIVASTHNLYQIESANGTFLYVQGRARERKFDMVFVCLRILLAEYTKKRCLGVGNVNGIIETIIPVGVE